METLYIDHHSLAGWASYANKFGFVPDPMILRTGEVFLNGASGASKMERTDFNIWNALQENMGALLDFFDMIVVRDAIPLISYGDTFDRANILLPLDGLLPDRMSPVEISHEVYNAVKKGALLNLAKFDLSILASFGVLARELDAFRYDWEPKLSVSDIDPSLDEATKKFSTIDQSTRVVAQFLLGGLIFSGFAQASQSDHYVQPKRARYFLGLTAAPDKAGYFSNLDEDAIFEATAASLTETRIEFRNADPLPPVLPYLLALGEPVGVRTLLDRALAFRQSSEGAIYRKAFSDVRADGLKARRIEDAIKVEQKKALQFLAPYSNIDTDRSRSLELNLSFDLFKTPLTTICASTTAQIRIPTWLRLWWNDSISFGGMRKTMRRMWMAEESYRNLTGKLGAIWARS